MTDDAAEWRKQLDALRRELNDHPGWIAKRRWDELRRTVDLHWRNLAELEQVIAAPVADLELAIELVQNVAPPVVREQYWAALDQRLHNTRASAVTLVDHARRLISDYPGTAFAVEFDRRNSKVKDDIRAAFIRRLRNYMLHYGVLPLAHQLRFAGVDSPQISFTVRLSAQVLRQWGRENWNAGAWGYLEQVGDYVDMGALIVWYREATVELFQWLFEQFAELHGDEVGQANELVQQYNLLISGGRDDGGHDDL